MRKFRGFISLEAWFMIILGLLVLIFLFFLAGDSIAEITGIPIPDIW
jgi:hypothetical protein